MMSPSLRALEIVQSAPQASPEVVVLFDGSEPI